MVAAVGVGVGGGEVQVEVEVRKGPWSKQEDVRLVWSVRLVGERRWDFLAKVSGLNRTGKSCRLRWVNYLHPGLKRGRITPDEERLVLQLHAKWGNRWSRIAKSMPGRTDNEIKNYWRTHMRKKAQQDKATRAGSGMSTSSSSSSSNNPQAHETVHRDSCDEEEEEAATAASQQLYTCSMDLQLWNDIDSASYVDGWSIGAGMAAASMPSPVWEYCSDSLWGIDDEEEEGYKKMLDAS